MLLIRHETPADHAAVRAVNQIAFPTTVEAEVVDRVRSQALVSLVAEHGHEVVGHILFTPATLEDGTGLAALGPMAVVPRHQGQGVGTLLAEAGLEVTRGQGHALLVVLGHPDYYPRFGFRPASPLVFRDESFASAFFKLELVPDAAAGRAGPVWYLPEFDDL